MYVLLFLWIESIIVVSQEFINFLERVFFVVVVAFLAKVYSLVIPLVGPCFIKIYIQF